MLPPGYLIRVVEPQDYEAIIEICSLVYPTERPYSAEELEDHRQVFAIGQFAVVERSSGAVAGVAFNLRLRLVDFHIDDPWDVLTAGGSFIDHNPEGTTLYCADLMVHPAHQHHGLGAALTYRVRDLVQEEKLWRMVGASRLPGYGKYCATMSIEEYVAGVMSGRLNDPVLSLHLKDGWSPVRPVHGYLQHDEESAGWAEVIQWVNPDCPTPPELDMRGTPARPG
jgi:GNAT superfamily N-acetyltransferase